MLEQEPTNDETASSTSFIVSTGPWSGNPTVSLGYPFYANQYVPPISAPTYTTPLTIGVGTGYGEIFTEERIRQLIREELTAYFDEEKDALSVSASEEDITQKQRDPLETLKRLLSLDTMISPTSSEEESIDD